jgi:hypothetical protein
MQYHIAPHPPVAAKRANEESSASTAATNTRAKWRCCADGRANDGVDGRIVVMAWLTTGPSQDDVMVGLAMVD